MRKNFEITGARLSGFDDSNGNVGPMEYYEQTMRLLKLLPKVGGLYTTAEIAIALKAISESPVKENH
jgi:hypothetical protein